MGYELVAPKTWTYSDNPKVDDGTELELKIKDVTPITPPPSRKPSEMSKVIPLKEPRTKKAPDLLQLRIELA